MPIKKWENLPADFQTEAIRPYYNILRNKRTYLFVKRFLDFIFSLLLLLLLSPLFLIICLIILVDSPGNPFFLQTRVSQYNRHFKIIKFRTMVKNAESLGTQVTAKADPRVLKSGSFLRKYRLDEIPQLINILKGDMSFVGTRPEVPRYVAQYSDEMLATLLLPAGVTSLASIKFKDEQTLLDNASNVERTYIEDVLPQKMHFNLEYLEKISFREEIKIVLHTVKEVFT